MFTKQRETMVGASAWLWPMLVVALWAAPSHAQPQGEGVLLTNSFFAPSGSMLMSLRYIS